MCPICPHSYVHVTRYSQYVCAQVHLPVSCARAYCYEKGTEVEKTTEPGRGRSALSRGATVAVFFFFQKPRGAPVRGTRTGPRARPLPPLPDTMAATAKRILLAPGSRHTVGAAATPTLHPASATASRPLLHNAPRRPSTLPPFHTVCPRCAGLSPAHTDSRAVCKPHPTRPLIRQARGSTHVCARGPAAGHHSGRVGGRQGSGLAQALPPPSPRALSPVQACPRARAPVA